MSTNIKLRKEKLIAQIQALKQEDVLVALEAIFEKNEKKYLLEGETSALSEPEVLYQKPKLRKTIDIETLKNERNYKHTDWGRMKILAREMDIKDPIEELLALLTK